MPIEGSVSFAQYEALKKQADELATALAGILQNVALDWYVEMFGRSEEPKGMSSGIAGKIHNRELNLRASSAFNTARFTYEAYEKFKGK